jgi:uncharacterized protein (DUF1499 family)
MRPSDIAAAIRRRSATAITLGGLVLSACSGSRPPDLGVVGELLRPCPSSPNCVSSDAPEGDGHHVLAFTLTGEGDPWTAARAAVEETPRTTVVTHTNRYLHAEYRIAVFGFVDDLELHYRPADGVIAVRSASRVGHSDLGVNRRRVEDLRRRLVERGIVRPVP